MLEGGNALDREQPSEVKALPRQGEQGASQRRRCRSRRWKRILWGRSILEAPPKVVMASLMNHSLMCWYAWFSYLSLLETQYSGENVVIISPDSDNLSVLKAALVEGSGGEDMMQHYKWAFEPGEVRMLQLRDLSLLTRRDLFLARTLLNVDKGTFGSGDGTPPHPPLFSYSPLPCCSFSTSHGLPFAFLPPTPPPSTSCSLKLGMTISPTLINPTNGDTAFHPK
jgi:hypothetical protein